MKHQAKLGSYNGLPRHRFKKLTGFVTESAQDNSGVVWETGQ